MKRREVVSDTVDLPERLVRFSAGEWYDAADPVPESAYRTAVHNRSISRADCAWVYRSVRALRRYQAARQASRPERGQEI